MEVWYPFRLQIVCKKGATSPISLLDTAVMATADPVLLTVNYVCDVSHKHGNINQSISIFVLAISR